MSSRIAPSGIGDGIIQDTAKEERSYRYGPRWPDETGKLIPSDIEAGDRVSFGNGPVPVQ